MSTTLRFRRSDLAKFFGNDHRLITTFEKMSADIDINNDTQLELIGALSLVAESAASNSNLALALIEFLNESAQLSDSYPVYEPEYVQPEIHLKDEKSNSFDYIDFDSNASLTNQVGRVFYGLDDTLNIAHQNGVVQQVGEEIYVQVTNNTGSTINNGTLVALISGIGVAPYNANGSVSPMYAIGLTTHNIANGERGRITQFGRVRGLNTSAYPVGAVLYANPAVLGGLTNVKPTSPNVVLPVGVVVVSSATNGQIFVRPILEQQRHFGSFAKTDDAALAAINTATAITLNTTVVSNGVQIDSLNSSRVVVSQSGLYTFSVSFQLSATNSSVKDVYLWFRKNGVDVPNTTIVHSLESGTAKTVQSRSYTLSLAANDYIELYWGSTDTGVSLSAIAATSFSPAAPSVILNVSQTQQ